MMKQRLLVAVCAILFVVSFGVPAQAEDADRPWIMYPVEKLGRGIANVAFGVFEVPMKMYDTTRENGGVAGLTYGVLKGVCYTIARVVVGVVDVATFPFPLPGCPNEEFGYGSGYGPIMKPAWVIDVEHDWHNFIYNEDTQAAPRY